MLGKTAGKISKITLRVALWAGIGIFGAVILLFLLLQLPQVQNYISQKAASYLSGKINSKVSLSELRVVFPSSIAIDGLYIEDQKQDTLVYIKSLKVGLDLSDIFFKNIELNSIQVEGFAANIYTKYADSSYNFDFILHAFAAPTKDSVKLSDSTTAWNLVLNVVQLKNCHLTFVDTISGINADLRLGLLNTRFDAFDLSAKKLHAEAILLQNSSVDYSQWPIEKETRREPKPFEYDIAVGKVLLDRVKALYTDNTNATVLDADITNLFLETRAMDIKNERMDLEQLLLSNSRINYTVQRMQSQSLDSLVTEQLADIKESSNKSNWRFQLRHLKLRDNSIAYDNYNSTPVAFGMDYNHLAARDLNLMSKNINVSLDKIELQMEHMALKEKSGFELKEFVAGIKYDSTGAGISGLKLETSNSKIGSSLAVSYPSIRTLKDSLNKMTINLDVQESVIGMADVLFFVPSLKNKASLKKYQSLIVNVDGKINGMLDELIIRDLVLSAGGNTEIKLDGRIQDLLQPEKMYADIAVMELKSTRADLYSLLPDNTIPQDIAVPEELYVKASFNGFVKRFNADVNISTSIGDIIASVKMQSYEENPVREYIGEITMSNFNIGSLLRKEGELGTVSLATTIKGSGYNLNNLNTQFHTHVSQAVIKGYNYTNLNVDGAIKETIVVANIAINDKNIVFDLDATVDMDTLNPHYQLKLDLKGADFNALHLYDEDLRISGQFNTDVYAAPSHNITGKVDLRNALIVKYNKRYPIDSIVVLSTEESGISNIRVKSAIVDADLVGTVMLTELPGSVNRYLNTYFAFTSMDSIKPLQTQKFNFQIAINDPVLLTELLLPDFKSPMPSSIKGEFNNNSRKLDVDLDLPQVIYNGMQADSMKMNITSDAERINYSVQLANLSNDIMQLDNLALNGDIQNNRIGFHFKSDKGKTEDILDIGGQLEKKYGDYILKLNSNLKLNAVNWNIDTSNYIRFGERGLVANQLLLSDGNQEIHINSPDKNITSSLEVIFKNLDLGTISRIIEKKEGLISGIVNGNVYINKRGDVPGILSDISLKNFAFNQIALGDIQLHGDNNASPEKYSIQLNIRGNGNDVDINGYYLTAVSDKKLNFDIDLKHINLKSIEPYTFGNVTSMSGTANGNLTLSGAMDAPIINGTIHLKSATFKPALIDSYLRVDQGKIDFDSEKLLFNSFTFFDSLNNKAILNGYVDIKNLKNPGFDLRLKTDNFLALNTIRKSTSLYYGKVYLNSDISVKGSPEHPVLDVKARINKGTTLTYIKPETSVAEHEGEGVVEFVIVDSVNAIMADKKADERTTSEIKGIDLNAIIDFDKDAQLKMIVDQVSGDSVYVKGDGSLEFSLTSDGKTNLTGMYNIADGGYHLSIGDLVKKDFIIEPGSYITWTGDIMDAYTDIKAIYRIKTSPIDLFETQLAGQDELQRNKYRNLVTFLVYLKMSGFISTPVISFDIQLPEDEKSVMNGTVNAKLNELRTDETDLNKQVFALLTLNRFIGDDPLQSGGGPASLSSTSRRSASRLLTQQLSALSAKYVKGVDLNLGVNSYEDYSSGKEEGRTQLQLGVSKQLFNDKVTVQVGGNVDIEGEKAKQNNASDIAGNIVVEYKLTDDGRYRLKGFRESEYENPIEGELTKTGGGLIFSKDYNKLMELFKKNRGTGK
ncbi:MAG: translocation/assembly module TamB domain-containing protein [Bacteroidia bacterium]